MIPYSTPTISAREHQYVQDVLTSGLMAGNGPFCKKVERTLEALTGCSRVLLTPSGTAALEMSVLLADIKPNDEVIMPSFTFPSTASAVAARGGIPIFVDIDKTTLGLCAASTKEAISSATKAILPVHYAGSSANIVELCEIAQQHNLCVIEDAAQAINAYNSGKHLGTFGRYSALSFHNTKNISSGEGGALLLNDPRDIERAEIIQEKGTNRAAFLNGKVDKYNWQSLGSSYVLSELCAAVLYGQLEQLTDFTNNRRKYWKTYHSHLEPLETAGLIKRPFTIKENAHNAHIYYFTLTNNQDRDTVLSELASFGCQATSHFVPLHSSPAGRKFGKAHGSLETTDFTAKNLIRLPIHNHMDEAHLQLCISAVFKSLSQ